MQRMIQQFAAEYTSKNSSTQDPSQPNSTKNQSLPKASPVTTSPTAATTQNPVLSKLLMADQDSPLDLTVRKSQSEPSEQDGVLDLSTKKSPCAGSTSLSHSPGCSSTQGNGENSAETIAVDANNQSKSPLEKFMVKLCTHHQKQFIRVLNDLYTEAQPGTEGLPPESGAMEASACSAGCAQLNTRHKEEDVVCLDMKSSPSVDLFTDPSDSHSPLHVTEQTHKDPLPETNSVDEKEDAVTTIQKEFSELSTTNPNSSSSVESSTLGYLAPSNLSSLHFHHITKSVEGLTTGQEQDMITKVCEDGKDCVQNSTIVESLTAGKATTENSEEGNSRIIPQRNSVKALSEETWDSGFKENLARTADKENALQCSSKTPLHQDLEADEQDARPKQENHLHSLGRNKVSYHLYPSDKGQYDHSKDGWLTPSPMPGVHKASNGHSRTKPVPASIKTARKSKRASGLRINDYDNQCDVVYISQPITECHFENQRSILSSRKTARKSTRGYFFNGDCCELPTVRTLARNFYSQEKASCSVLASEAVLPPKQTFAPSPPRPTADVHLPTEDSPEEPGKELTSLKERGRNPPTEKEPEEPEVCTVMDEPNESSSPRSKETVASSLLCPLPAHLPEEDMPKSSSPVNTVAAHRIFPQQDQQPQEHLDTEKVSAVQDWHLIPSAESISEGNREEVLGSLKTVITEQSPLCLETQSLPVDLEPPVSQEKAKDSERFSPVSNMIISPEAERSISPETKRSISPEADPSVGPTQTSISSQIESTISPEAKTSISPDTESNVNPEILPGVPAEVKANVSPGPQASVRPTIETDVSIKTETSVKVSIRPEMQTSVSPEAETSVSPEDETSVSPEDKTNISSEAETGVNPEIQTNVSPEAETSVSSEAETGVSPEIQTNVSLEAETGVSPEIQTDVSPEAETCVTSEAETVVSPEIQTDVSPEAEISVSPEIKKGVNPETQTDVSPEAETSISSEAETGVSPEIQTSVSPEAAETGVSPEAAETGVSPEVQTGISPEAETSVSSEVQTVVSPEAETSVSSQAEAGGSPEAETNISPGVKIKDTQELSAHLLLRGDSVFTKENPSEIEKSEAADDTGKSEGSDVRHSLEQDMCDQNRDSPEEHLDKKKKSKKYPEASDRCLRSQLSDSSSSDRYLRNQNSDSLSVYPEIKVSKNYPAKRVKKEGCPGGTMADDFLMGSFYTKAQEDPENLNEENPFVKDREQERDGGGIITRQTFKNMLAKEVKVEKSDIVPGSDPLAVVSQLLPGGSPEICVQSTLSVQTAPAPPESIPPKAEPEHSKDQPGHTPVQDVEEVVNEQDRERLQPQGADEAPSSSSALSGGRNEGPAESPAPTLRPRRLASSTYNLRQAHSLDSVDTTKVASEKETTLVINPTPKESDASEGGDALEEADGDTAVEEQPRFVEWCAEEENQELIANFNAQYMKVQKGWIQLEKEGQPTPRARNKSDKLKEIWKSKKRSRKCRGSLEGQKFSPVQMLFMTNFKLSNVCKWFLETTETRSLVITKKLNTRLPGDTPPAKHPLQKYSPSSLYPSSLQAERLKKHLKKFPGATPIRNNWKTQKLLAKFRENPVHMETEEGSDASLNPTSEGSIEEVKEERSSHAPTNLATPASTRILRKYSNIRGKLRAQQNFIKNEKVECSLSAAADSKQSRKSVCINPLMSPKLALQVDADGFPVKPKNTEGGKGRKGKQIPESVPKAEVQNKRKRTEGSSQDRALPSSKDKGLAVKGSKDKQLDASTKTLATKKPAAKDKVSQLPKKISLKENKVKIPKKSSGKDCPASRKEKENTNKRPTQTPVSETLTKPVKQKGTGEPPSKPPKYRNRKQRSGKTQARPLMKSPENNAAQRKRKPEAKLDPSHSKRRRLDAK